MTAPDRPVQDLIAEAVAAALPQSLQPVGAGLRNPPEMGGEITGYGQQIVDAVVPAVVAACREATVQQQAQLVRGEIQRSAVDRDGQVKYVAGRMQWSTRVVTAWREDPS